MTFQEARIKAEIAHRKYIRYVDKMEAEGEFDHWFLDRLYGEFERWQKKAHRIYVMENN